MLERRAIKVSRARADYRASKARKDLSASVASTARPACKAFAVFKALSARKDRAVSLARLRVYVAKSLRASRRIFRRMVSFLVIGMAPDVLVKTRNSRAVMASCSARRKRSGRS
jgi:hypothetical protein